MPVPDRFRSSFASATLQAVDKAGDKLRVASPLFFRTAYTANVVENQRRTFNPLIVVEPAKIRTWRCDCNLAMRSGDLCRHIAALLVRASDGSGSLAGEQFEHSVWRAIGFAAFTEARELAVPDSDLREQTLRRFVLTEQEQELIKRGAGSTRLQWESSPWYRWAKSMFLRFGDASGATLIQRDGAFHLVVDDFDVALPPTAVEHVVERVAGFTADREGLTPSFRIALTRDRALKLTPVLIDRRGVIHDRTALPRFGKWFFVNERFASPCDVGPLFAEKTAKPQAVLFDVRPSSGLPLDHETVIPEADVFRFLDMHRETLAEWPPELAPEPIRNAQPVRLDGDVLFDCSAAGVGFIEADIRFAAGDDAITAAEIAKARKDGIRALNRGNLWIDLADTQFAWLDEATIGKNGRVLVTKLELLRIRGSLRGKPVFRGDAASERVFRMFDEVQSASDAPTPSSLGLSLYAYQQTGYHWLWLLQSNGFGGLLCDDMGLGKTHQAMALIAALTDASPATTVLVVCPTSLLDHWKQKLAVYAPRANVELTSYGIVRSRIEQFRGRRFDLLILDEAQTIKNAETATYQSLRAIERRIAVGLTGTPIENHESELKTLLDFVVPGYLPREVDDRRMLQRLVRPFVLRRTKAQVLTDLPPKIVDKRYCEMTAEQRALYAEVMRSRAKPLRALLRAGGRIPYIHVFAALNYLKQICNDPRSVGGGMATPAPSGKWELFTEILDECMASGLKVVVFSQYLAMLGLIEQHLSDRNLGFASIKGATKERGNEIRRFHEDPACRVFTASLRAGGLGIDLTSASVVIHYDRWWNQAREDQATDRVHRLGQNSGVQVLKLITRHTVEEKIDELIARKATLATDLIRPDDPNSVKQFSVEELEELLGE